MTERDTSGSPSSTDRRVRLAWTVGTLIALLASAGIVLWARSGFTPPPQVFFLTNVPYVLSFVMLTTQGSASVLLTVRRPGNAVGWMIMAFAAILSGVVLANGYLALTETGWVGPFDPAWWRSCPPPARSGPAWPSRSSWA